MELNGHAAAGALTPATAQVVTDDHSNNDELTRYRRPVTSEQTVAAQEISRFMPVMGIEQALQRRQAIVDATQKLMRPGVDFGSVSGADRDVLLQPGADKLCNLFGLVIHYEVAKSEEDWTGERHGGTPFFFYEVRGRAYRGDFLMGEGVGSCSSWETKYRWRKAERTCPCCGKANIRKSNREEGWYCWTKTEGCGAKFPAGDAAIESQETGRKVNPDMADVVNTVLKMAYKRSKVSTTINATSASEFFTQDLEEQGGLSAERGSHGHQRDATSVPNGTTEPVDKDTRASIPELDGQNADLEIATKDVDQSRRDEAHVRCCPRAGRREPLSDRTCPFQCPQSG